ncbi:putative non-specific serine/threonine protein kinase [Helianthus debilis subsp. tardiflorus]
MVEKIIDPYLVDKVNPISLKKYLETVEKCLKNTGDERPSMLDVLWVLIYALKLQQMVENKEPNEDSIINTSLEWSTLITKHLPSKCDDGVYDVNDNLVSSYPSESQVFSKLKIDEAR